MLSAPIAAQVMEGELRITINDPSGSPVPAQVELTSRNPQFSAGLQADTSGIARLQRLPPGVYRLSVRQTGFQDFDDAVEIRSAVPQSLEVMLMLAGVATNVTVTESAPLLDIAQPAVVLQANREQLEQTPGTTLGRSTVDVVTTMPGWLLEANAILHPRGSEYDTQYVVDGIPVYDNRSIGFAPAFENDEFEAVNIITAGLPAEYGRRLGGVIALDTRRVATPGHNSEVAFQTGSFGNHAGSFMHQYSGDKTALSFGAHSGRTNRYLDPPSVENFTNKGSAGGFNARFERDLMDRDRLTLYLRSNRTNFLVPNDLVQQAAGQRQDRSSSETTAQAHYQHVFSSRTLGAVRGMFRDLTAKLWSNPQSTPAYVDQNRGFREGAVIGSIVVENERHTLKFGGDLRVNSIRERFLLARPDELPDFDVVFDGRERSTETSVFIQDNLRWRNFSAALGLRFDHYSLRIQDDALSPRVALGYYIPRAGLMLRASYDRIFQPPPTENLLLSSSAGTLDIDAVEQAIAVPASRANFFEAGLRKPFWNVFRLDVSHYWRTFRNNLDDDVFLNTGISFPITFDSARIEGTEVRLELPRWKSVSSFVSYSNMIGHAGSPVTGGLFIEGGEAEKLRDVVEQFPITQDQRNTLAAQIRFEPDRRVWFALDTRYGSGLPVELVNDDDEEEHEESQLISPAILDKVNFERGRIQPNFSLNFSVGARVWEQDARSATLQFDIRNVTGRLNLINFNGLFSGTALAPGRQLTLQMRVRF
jgi:outer membrane cobalamin receptor